MKKATVRIKDLI